MTDDFRQRVEAAKGKTTSVKAAESKKQLDENPEILLIETRLRDNVPDSETTESQRTGHHDLKTWKQGRRGRPDTPGDGIRQRVLYGRRDGSLERGRPADQRIIRV